MNILIGSRALALRQPSFHHKPTADWDIISEQPIDGSEHHKFTDQLNDELEPYLDGLTTTFNGHTLHVPTLKGLTIIKRSHLWRNVGFDKHITMYHRHMIHNVSMTPSDLDYLARRTTAVREQLGDKYPSLRKSVTDFFDDYVTKKYDHDHLHRLVAVLDEPIYRKMQRDFTSAWCEKDMWDALPTHQKLLAVYEEATVIAIERILVPSEWTKNPRLAYYHAMCRICTNLTSGWFRDFAIDNFPAIMQSFSAERMLSVREQLTT